MNAVERPRSSSDKPSKPGRKSGVVTPHQPTALQRAGAWIVCFALRCVARTLRYKWNDPLALFSKPSESPAIFAIWHNRLALCPEGLRVYRGINGRDMAALVSASKDGAFLAAILEQFRIQPVRGSSSRRGPQALLELTTWAERGCDLAITPDGPRGPCYTVHDGIMVLAQVTGMPIVPFAYNTRWCVRLKSWDRFVIPLPFAKCEMNVGRPIHVPREAGDAERAAIRNQLQAALMALTREE